MLMDMAARRRCVVVGLNCAHAVIRHRTSEAPKRPGCEREQNDGTTEAAAGLDSPCARVGHGSIIRVPHCRVKVGGVVWEVLPP